MPNRMWNYVFVVLLISAGVSLIIYQLMEYGQNKSVFSRQYFHLMQNLNDSLQDYVSPVKDINKVPNTNESDNDVSYAKNYTILFWKHGKRMLRRFLRSYGKVEHDPFQFCSVRNCRVQIDDVNDLNESDAVMIHLHRTQGPNTLPPYRLPHQRWIFFTDESPLHTFLVTREFTMKDYNGYFNWSMTYRSDSDIPVPYGRTVPLSKAEKAQINSLPNYAKLKSRLVAVMGSNCGGANKRWQYIHSLEKYLKVDIFGHCGKLKCPGHFTTDCLILKEYKFYLAFENSNCKEYITEKMWWNGFHKESVPVVMGGDKEDYKQLCPPGSYIHVEDFDSPQELANYIIFLDGNDTAYNKYFEWKKNYKVLNEHGYFGSPSLHICRICEALNINKSPKTYHHLENFWNKDTDCRGSVLHL
ncbi:4-galactosyl-N-acetylglucosaminide 3-alpha-L-fucosyltransferase FUT6-like [Tachypleus tridentatus]|uniref:4-galactosyl-N-acetylglucosaminide 3-alpha-L-fucosyltransferase FUT6-like n=1 Tax=Tachypleus tridentatus TaxID=6853 RepID=UPI003FD55244